jgi:hypothetical protein
MNIRRRLEKLELLARPVASKVANRDMKGVAWKELVKAVNEAIDDADVDLYAEILDLLEERAKEPLRDPITKVKDLDDEGREIPTPHFFTIWLWGLQEGSWRLPARLPREVLQGFCRRHGAVLFRCENCLLGLGNARLYAECPVCHSAEISCKNLGGPPWDSLWVYTPRPKVRHVKK